MEYLIQYAITRYDSIFIVDLIFDIICGKYSCSDHVDLQYNLHVQIVHIFKYRVLLSLFTLT
jgi:hypothetical protein